MFMLWPMVSIFAVLVVFARWRYLRVRDGELRGLDHSAITSARNHQLDGLRGYAAICVACIHTITAMDFSQVTRIEWTVFWDIPDVYGKISKVVFALLNGETAVIIFFILSGAVLVRSLMRSTAPLTTTAWQFVIRRIFRIYPALLLCLFLCWAAFNLIVRPVSPDELVNNVILYDYKVNWSTWTLGVEMLAIPFILLAFAGYRHSGEIGLVGVLAAIWVVFTYILPPDVLAWLRYVWFCFALGMIIPTRIGQFVAYLLPRHAWIPALILMLFARHFIPDLNVSMTVHRFAAATLVTCVYYGKAGALGRFLGRPVSLFLGGISYSFYLYAVLVMEIIDKPFMSWSWAQTHPLEVGLPLSVAVVALTIPIAMASYRWIELPAIKLGNRIVDRFGRGAANKAMLGQAA